MNRNRLKRFCTRSLTAAAYAITGSHISGNLFFGIQRKRGDS